MIINCISDLHGHYPELEGGDLLIVAGDLTARDEYEELDYFQRWLQVQNYKKKIVIAGNHDNQLMRNPNWIKTQDCDYLCDSGTEFVYYPALEKDTPEGKVLKRKTLKIWGSPWTQWFHGVNPHCKAFMLSSEEKLAKKWALIPDDVDILVTHSPSFGNYDWVKNRDGSIGESKGSVSLWLKCLEIRPKLHVFGHIHEAYGHSKHINGINLVNASYVNEHYQPVNKPIRVIL